MAQSATTDSTDDRPIAYVVTCSDNIHAEKKFIFHQHTAPASLCRQLNPSSNQDKMRVSAVMVNLIRAHDDEILRARSWSCVECNCSATTLVHNAMSYLHLEEPQAIDFTAPCCAKKTCDRQIRVHFAELMATVGVPTPMS